MNMTAGVRGGKKSASVLHEFVSEEMKTRGDEEM